MKKNLLNAVVVLLAVLMLGMTVNATNTRTFTDEELVIMYLNDEHGSDKNYEVEIIDSEAMDGEGIDYFGYEDGRLRWCGYINREFYTNKYQNQ